MRGIDVSNHRGLIDWSKAKNHIDFAIIKAGYGKECNQVDAQFENNYKGCKANNIPCGVFWYSYATTVFEAIQEAKVCLETIKGKQFEFPIYYDVEEPRIFNSGQTSEIVKAFCSELESRGYWVGIYASKSHLETYFSEEVRRKYAVWVAHYGVNKTSYKGQYGMWQYSDKGSVEGVSGNVDLDECYINYPSQIKTLGLNGFVKYSKPTVILNYSTYTVQKGDNLWNIAAKLLGDGSRYKEIMKLNNLNNDKIYPNQKLKVPKR